MAENFYTILTNVGKAKIANATALGTKVDFTTLKVGDSNGTYYNPTEAQEDLVHTVWQGNINSITTDPKNPSWIVVVVVLPSNVGGFTVREVGIFDDDGDMLAIGKYPETYKPVIANGSVKDINIRMILEVTNNASVTLKIDPSVTLATQEDIQALRNQINNISVPVKSVNEKTGDIVLEASDIKTDDGTTLEEVKGDFTTHLADNETESSNLNARINNLNTNDLQARNEIMDIKLKLKEQVAIEFINKTGVGFYDTFADNSNIDTTNTTATYNSTNKNVEFAGQQTLKMKDEIFDTFNNLDLSLYPDKINKATIKGTVNNSTTVITGATDKPLTAGDKLFMDSVLNEVLNATGNYVTNTVTDATVINQAYDTSGNGGRKLVRLSNEWLVASCLYSSSQIKFYIDKRDGNGFIPSCTIYAGAVISSWAIQSKGNIIYGIHCTVSSKGSVCTFNFDTTTIGTTTIDTSLTAYSIDSTQTNTEGGCSLVIDSTGNYLHAAWSSKNSSYPDSFNIRYAKGTINTDGSVTWGSVEQVTTANTSGMDYKTPSIIPAMRNGKPQIICNITYSGNNGIKNCYWVSSSWNDIYIYNSGSYAQSSPCAMFVPQSINGLANGRIWVAWHGLGSSHTAINYTFLSYSDDGGVTWSTVITIEDTASGNLTITYDKTGLVYVVYQGFGSNTFVRYKTINNTGTVSDYVTINSTGTNPSTLLNYNDFSIPLFIYKNTSTSKIGFYGTWTVGEGYTLTMQNPATLTDGQQVPIVDFSVQQNNSDLELDNIDTEKFVFKGGNLNTDTTSIKVLGKDNKLNAIAYAIA